MSNENVDIKDINKTTELSQEEMSEVKGGATSGGGTTSTPTTTGGGTSTPKTGITGGNS